MSGKLTQIKLTQKEKALLIDTLKDRFEKNMNHHKEMNWRDIEARLHTNSDKLRSLNEMERTGGEPDVVGYNKKSGEYIFFDCAAESPKGRRSLCYDRQALDARKEHKPQNSVIDMATQMGIQLLDEDQYRELQNSGDYDTKTSSWILTPADIRKRGGALFADCRYGHLFVYHNGADSYYAARGFRGFLKL
jgi:hypothetical protein